MISSHFLSKVSLGGIAILFISSVLFALMFTQAKAFSTVELEGYAWSSNIGWISLNCSNDVNPCGSVANPSNYKVQINPDKTLSGYAWSSNIGWIQFGGLSGFPAAGGNAAVAGDYANGWSFDGWARALANGNGWDGWISLSGTTPDYAVDYNNAGNMSGTSYAWGADVVGWVNFSLSYFTPPNSDVGNTCTLDYLGTIYTDMWGDEVPAEATVCAVPFECPKFVSNPSCPDPATVAALAGTVDLTLSATFARKGGTVDITWSDPLPPAIASCRVISTSGDIYASSPAVSQPLVLNTNTFTLYCNTTGLVDDEVPVDTEEVRLLPTLYGS